MKFNIPLAIHFLILAKNGSECKYGENTWQVSASSLSISNVDEP